MHWRDRLERPRGYNEPDHAHELTFSCYRQFAFLSNDRTCHWLADAIRAAKAEVSYSLWAYVFMPDHVHLIVFPQARDYDDGGVSQTGQGAGEPKSRAVAQARSTGLVAPNPHHTGATHRASFLAARARA